MNFIWGFVFIITTFAACTPGDLASSLPPAVSVHEDNLRLLKGWWIGKYESRGLDGTKYFDHNLYLEIPRTGPSKGSFSLGTGGTWETVVEVKNGKIELRIDRHMREFVLKEKEGKLFLESSYLSTWEGPPRNNRIFLEKHRTK